MIIKRTSFHFLIPLFGIICFIAFSYILYLQIFYEISKKNNQKISNSAKLTKKLDSLDLFFEKYSEYLMSSDPRYALSMVRRDLVKDKDLAKNCHSVVHELGRRAFVKYNNSFNQAVQFQDVICNSGYIHGVIEAKFKGSSNLDEELKTVCDGQNQSEYNNWQCFHGIGHGIMFSTNNNLPLSISYCKKLGDDSNVTNCVNGTYMENFNADNSLHPSTFIKKDDLFFPCNQENFPYRYACYYYAPIQYLKRHPEGYSDAIKWCNGAGDDAQYCKAGVIGQAVKNNFDDLSQIEGICKNLDNAFKQACIESAVSMVVNMTGNVNESKLFCNQLIDNDFKRICVSKMEEDILQFN